ncbi:hypothetical protein L249_3061, partial [Ophiocordyceps polyrhachis-furcata BCC 54312]
MAWHDMTLNERDMSREGLDGLRQRPQCLGSLIISLIESQLESLPAGMNEYNRRSLLGGDKAENHPHNNYVPGRGRVVQQNPPFSLHLLRSNLHIRSYSFLWHTLPTLHHLGDNLHTLSHLLFSPLLFHQNMSLKLYVTTLILSLALTGSVSAADGTKLIEIRGSSEEYEKAFKSLLAKTQLKATWERGKGPSSSEKREWKQDSCDSSDDPEDRRGEELFFDSIEPQEGCWAKLLENQSLLPKELSDRPPKVEFEIIKTEQPGTRVSNGGTVSVRDSNVTFNKVTQGWNAGISLVFGSLIPLTTLDILHAGHSSTWESGQSVIKAVDHKDTCPRGWECHFETWTLMATYTGTCAPHVLFQPRCDPPEAFEPCPAFRDYARSKSPNNNNRNITWPQAPTPWDEKRDGGKYKCRTWYNTAYEHCKAVDDLHTDCQLRLPALDSSGTGLWTSNHFVMTNVLQAAEDLSKEAKDAPEAVEAHSQHQCVWKLANGHYYYEVTDGYVFKQQDGKWTSEIQPLAQFKPPKVSDQLRSSADCSCDTLMDLRRDAGVDQDTPTKCHGDRSRRGARSDRHRPASRQGNGKNGPMKPTKKPDEPVLSSESRSPAESRGMIIHDPPEGLVEELKKHPGIQVSTVQRQEGLKAAASTKNSPDSMFPWRTRWLSRSACWDAKGPSLVVILNSSETSKCQVAQLFRVRKLPTHLQRQSRKMLESRKTSDDVETHCMDGWRDGDVGSNFRLREGFG